MPDFISGDTDAMLAYRPIGPEPGVVGAPARLSSRIVPGGLVLTDADQQATQQLAEFVTAANARIDALVQRAGDAGRDYLSTEQVATAKFSAVTPPVTGE